MTQTGKKARDVVRWDRPLLPTIGLAAALALSGCNGSDNEDVARVSSLLASSCKGDAEVTIKLGTDPKPELFPLECVSWQRQADGSVSIDLLNIHYACMMDSAASRWQGTMKEEGDGQILAIAQPSCGSAVCGWCLFDFSLNVEQAGPMSSLAVSINGCPPDSTPTVVGTVDLSAESGTRCRYNFESALSAGSHRVSGIARSPCRDPATTDLLACDEDLQCVEDAAPDGASLCLPRCQADADCLSMETCEDGLCRLEPGW